jgi:hypothetical protein
MSETSSQDTGHSPDFPLLDGARIDAPHKLGRGRTRKKQGKLAAVSGDDSEPISEPGETDSNESPALELDDDQLRTHATQLGSWLRQQKEDLQQRQTLLNSQADIFDKELRTARLWLSEKKAELDQRENTLEEQTTVMDQLRAEAVDFEAKTAWQQRYRDQNEQLQKRLNAIHKIELELDSSLEENRRIARELALSRRESDEKEQERLEQFEQNRARWESERSLQQKRLDKKGEQLDRSDAAIEHLRDELEQSHRETLKLRLTVEELRLELADGTPSAELTRSINRIRTELDNQYRLSESRLGQRNHDLAELADQIELEHRRMNGLQNQLEKWTLDRQEQIEAGAARLVEREKELEIRSIENHLLAHDWQDERLHLQAEIRRLTLENQQLRTERVDLPYSIDTEGKPLWSA